MHVIQFVKSCHTAPPGGRLIFSKNTDFDTLCFRSISHKAFEQSMTNLAGILVHIRGRLGSILEPIRNPIWPPGGHLGFYVPLNI